MSEPKNRLIFIADDEPDVLATFQNVLKRSGFSVLCFLDGSELLDNVSHASPACILIDVNMPALSGLAVLRALVERAYNGPIIVISGVGDIPMAVEAIHNGAWDFLEKPLDGNAITEAVERSIAGWETCRRANSLVRWWRPFLGHELLTSRETEVLQQVMAGATSKEIGRALGISWRTVETHRSRILEKTGTRTLLELMGHVLRAQADQRHLAQYRSAKTPAEPLSA